MRRLMIFLAVALSVAACTPRQVAEVMGHPGRVTTKDVEVATAVNRAQTDSGRSFLELAAALHNDPFLVCTRAHESDTAGGYLAYNPSGPYFGAYQYLQSTWNTAVVNYGNNFPQFRGVDPRSVPGFFQDDVTFNFHNAVGNGPWAGRC